MWLAGDVMLGDRCLVAGRLLGQEGGFVASRGCDAVGRCHMARRLLGQEGGCVVSMGRDTGR